jgi:hypothetical protein
MFRTDEVHSMAVLWFGLSAGLSDSLHTRRVKGKVQEGGEGLGRAIMVEQTYS